MAEDREAKRKMFRRNELSREASFGTSAGWGTGI